MEQRENNIKSGRQGLFNLTSTEIMLVVRAYIKAVATSHCNGSETTAVLINTKSNKV